MKNKEMFKLGLSIANNYIQEYEYPYEVLPYIKDIILKLGLSLGNDYYLLKENVWVHKESLICENNTIIGPCIIDKGSIIKPGAYIRENVIIGKKCVLGNSCEIKNSILYDFVQIPHFNYVGDSIIGNYSHMGAGSIISNLKSDKSLINIKYNNDLYKTNLKKVGAFLSDYVEIGCNSVLNPGTVVKSNTTIYPLVNVRGVIESNLIVKNMNEIIEKN